MSEYTEETNTDNTEEPTKSSTSKYTEVKTGYARAAMSLLTVNLFLTGYCIFQISNYQGQQIDGVSEQTEQNAGNTVRAITKPEKPTEEKETKEKED